MLLYGLCVVFFFSFFLYLQINVSRFQTICFYLHWFCHTLFKKYSTLFALQLYELCTHKATLTHLSLIVHKFKVIIFYSFKNTEWMKTTTSLLLDKQFKISFIHFIWTINKHKKLVSHKTLFFSFFKKKILQIKIWWKSTQARKSHAQKPVEFSPERENDFQGIMKEKKNNKTLKQ